MNFTPELATVMKAAIEDRLFDLHTGMPGVIVSYDPTKQRATINPSLMRRYPTGEVVSLPNLPDVPVWFPAGSNFSLTYPIAQGDPCVLMFSERSIEIWKRDGGILNPRDPRKFHLSDCFAFVGGRPLSNLIEGASSTDFRIKLGGTTLTIKPSGEVEITNGTGTFKMTPAGKFKIAGAENLISLVKELAEQTATAQVLTVLGPQGILPPNSTNIAEIATKLGTILET